MKLLILSESPLDKIGEDYFAVDPWIKIPVRLADKCEQVTLWAPVMIREPSFKPSQNSWKVDLGKLEIEPHDYYYRYNQYYRLLPKKFFSWKKKAKLLSEQHDVVIIRAPSPMGSLLTRQARKKNRPVVPIILLNIETQSDRLIQSRGLKKLLYSWLVKAFIRQEKQITRNSALTYVYSKELEDRHRHLDGRIKMMQDPHLSLKDFYFREDSCQSINEIRLLRLCWLIPSKGVEYLLDSVAILKKRNIPVKLEIVGQERTAGYQLSLENHAKKLGIENDIVFSGWLPFNRVSEAYIRNDIQILSSLGEGTPRCIVEGFARGLPLVCTDVGGCHDTLKHEEDALLVQPKDPLAMANAIERMIKDGELRKRLIKNGYENAKKITFELVGDQFIQELEELTH